MNLRPNYFGLAVNSGLSIFIAVILFRSSNNFLGALFLAISVVHLMRLKRVSVNQDQIVVKYPFAPFLQDKFIPNRSLVSFRFVSGYYTDWNAVILRYKNEKGIQSLRIPFSPFDRKELEKNLATR